MEIKLICINCELEFCAKSKLKKRCKECKRLKINESNRKYHHNNLDKIHTKDKIYYENNKEKILLEQKQDRFNNLEKYAEKDAKYYQNNKQKRNEYCKKYNKEKRKNDTSIKIKENISSNIRSIIKENNGNKNNESKDKYLPFTYQELKDHIEAQFYIEGNEWMHWENYGKYNSKIWSDEDQSTWTWNLDHIIPQSKLQYSSMTDENFKKCWDLNNLRPYSAKQNCIDNNKR